MNSRFKNLPEGHPRRQIEEMREAQLTDPVWVANQVTAAAQTRLDTFAKVRGYDNIMSACTYVTSKNKKFAMEAKTCVDLRDATWSTCYKIMEDVAAGKRPLPTLEEAMLELPELVWTT